MEQQWPIPNVLAWQFKVCFCCTKIVRVANILIPSLGGRCLLMRLLFCMCGWVEIYDALVKCCFVMRRVWGFVVYVYVVFWGLRLIRTQREYRIELNDLTMQNVNDFWVEDVNNWFKCFGHSVFSSLMMWMMVQLFYGFIE